MDVLILNGTAESGKGTVVKYLESLFSFNITEYSSIDYVKKVARRDFGWDGQKDVAGRNLLAAIKQLMIAYNDLPLKKVILQMNESLLFGIDILVVDIREPDEIEKVVKYCEEQDITCYTCRIINTKAENKAEKSGLSLTGDRLYGEYDYNIYIINNGTLKELKEQVSLVFGTIYKEAERRKETATKLGGVLSLIKEGSYKDALTLSYSYYREKCHICGHTELQDGITIISRSCVFCGQSYYSK
ncbi:MAG: hypothetical protein GY853_10045 [PVC group bacterium]|nr:hypothetical protein [PVC group bacterium]